MVEASLPAPDDVRPWPGILNQPRRAMRVAADDRIWLGPMVVMLLVPVAGWALRSSTGAPAPKVLLTGHPLGDIALGWAGFAIGTIVFGWGLGRMVGGRATLVEVCIVMLWQQLPWLLLQLPIDGLGVALHGSAWWSMPGSIFDSSKLLSQPADVTILRTIGIVAAAWSLGLSIIGLSEVHRISAWRVVFLIALPLFMVGVFTAVLATILVAKYAAVGGH